MIPLPPFGLQGKLIAGALVALALLFGALHVVNDLEGRGAARVEAQRLADTAAAAASAAQESARIEAAQRESDHEADRFNALAEAGAVRATDAGGRLQQRFDAAANCGVPNHSAPVASGASAADAGDLRADVFRRVREAAGQFAGIADERGGAGAKAERDYDSLTPPAEVHR